MPRRRPGSLKTLDTLGDLMNEVSVMLEKSLSERDRALDHVGRSLASFEAKDAVIRAELAELPPELDAYLRLVRDKRKMEARRKALEAQSISHALNFHLGGGENEGVVWGGAGPSIMDELRAEEEELDRQAALDEMALKEHLEWEANGGDDGGSGDGGGDDGGSGGGMRRKKNKKKQKQKPVDSFLAPRPPRSDKAVAEAEAYQRFNMRDGLFAHLDASNEQEAELEASVEASPEGSLGKLEAESKLAQFRAKRGDEVAEFFHGYNPQRVQRSKEEPLSGLGLSLEDPAEFVANVERSHFEGAALAEGMTLEDLGLSSSGGGGGGGGGLSSPLSHVSGGGDSFAGGGGFGGLVGGAGGEFDSALWGAPRPLSQGRGGLLPTEGMGGRPASSGGGNRMPTEGGGLLEGGGGGGRQRRAIPGVGVAQKLSDQTVNDPYMGRGILDLPSFGASSPAGGEFTSVGNTSASPGGGGGGDFDDIRGTVQDNTNPVDLSFPTLEFRRRKQQDRNATYFTPGETPKAFHVAQTEGAVWSSMARERREIEAEERQQQQQQQRGSPGGSADGYGMEELPFREKAPKGAKKKKKKTARRDH